MIANGIAPASAETATAPDFGMTELEEALRGPDGEVTRQSVVARIDALIHKIEYHLSIGVDPRQLESINCVRKSLAVTRNIVIDALR